MKILTKLVSILVFLTLSTFCFCEDNNEKQEVVENIAENNIKTIDREKYQIQIKQYDKNYPIALYVVFKEATPLIDEIRKILRTELLVFAKTEVEPALQDSLKKEEEEKKKENNLKNNKEEKQKEKSSKSSKEEKQKENYTKINKKEEQNEIEKETGLETIKKVIIVSAWFNDQVSENLEKIELTKKYGAFVWLYDKKDKEKIFTFEEYLRYLKKKKENFKKKEKLEISKDTQK